MRERVYNGYEMPKRAHRLVIKNNFILLINAKRTRKITYNVREIKENFIRSASDKLQVARRRASRLFS